MARESTPNPCGCWVGWPDIQNQSSDHLQQLSALATGTLYGVPGILLAGPWTVTAFVLVRILYVEDALGEPLGQEQGNRY